ncbi:MAG: hypothetical protein GXO26_09765 [Crenarchaeota archaeon]|nr:hypothetical protein [Thermoproteota archaeon]
MLRKILKIRKITDNVREIVTIDEKVILARCITLENREIIDIDVVEKIHNIENIVEERSIDNRRIMLVKLRENVLGLVYEYDNERELISLKIIHEGTLSDEDLINIFENTLKDMTPTYYEKVRKILEKYYKGNLT